MRLKKLGYLFIALIFVVSTSRAGDAWITIEGKEGPGKGQHIVFVTGDEEYRSEESMPQLAKILAKHHGFTCTVLFAIDREDGTINPEQVDNIPGLHNLEKADLMVLFTRFRELPDKQMKHIIDYLNTDKPIMALRTATHAFRYKDNLDSPYAKYSFRDKEFEGGFGRQILGETWVSHHGVHQKESTRGVIAEGMEDHPIVQGCDDIWGPSDVYTITTLTGDSQPLVMGKVLQGMNHNDPPNNEKAMMPVAWIKTYTTDNGKTSNIFTTTMGHSGDLKNEDFRRLLVNATYWLLDMTEKITPNLNVDIVGTYDPNPIGFEKHKKGLTLNDVK